MSILALGFVVFITMSIIHILINITRTNERVNQIIPIVNKIQTIENSISSVLEFVSADFLESSEATYVSKDGKYSAGTLQELIEKMADGGDLDVPEEESKELTDFFMRITNEIEEIDFNDNDSDTDDETWKK
jgi:hypothetical protein